MTAGKYHCGILAANKLEIPNLNEQGPTDAVQADVTRLLQRWTAGDKSAEEKLWPIIFSELKRLARRHMARERTDHTLQSGALLNEAYIRLTGWHEAKWNSRAHFFGMWARMMRQILVDHARSREYEKRGGGAQRVTLDESAIISESSNPEFVELDDALTRLEQISPRKALVIELRFFGGLSVDETAEYLKVSRLTVIRDWNFARSWLLTELRRRSDKQ